MKKICMITTVSSTLKSFVVETAKYLHNQKGYDVTLVCDNDEAFAKSLPEYLHFKPIAMSRGISLSGFRAIKEFEKFFKEEKFDMVQYATPNASFYASIAAKKAKVPLRAYCQWGIRYVGFLGIKRRIFKFLEKIVCKKSTHIFAVSPLNMQFAIKEKLYSQAKAQVIGNGGTIGVDVSAYNVENKGAWKKKIRDAYHFDGDDFVFGFVGRISIDKGCNELLTAFREMNKTDARAKLFIVGPMEEDCGVDQNLLQWAKTCPQVIFTGRVNHNEIREYYAAIDVLLHPTYREGFGMVIQEAGALGIPTITTNIPGASEVMKDNESCILISPKNAQQLQDAMIELFTNREQVSLLGQAAYKRTMALYERSMMLKNQQAVYEKLLEE